MVKLSIHLLCAWLLAVVPMAALAQPKATATFDRSTIYEGESVTLTVKVATSIDNEVDLEPLTKDFEIVTTSESSRMQNINGKRFVSTQWDVTLEPLHAGKIEVPPLTVGRHTTAPVVLEVLAREISTDANQAQDMFLEVSVEPRDPYVQSQVLYTLRLHHTLPITEGSLGEPDLPFAVIERIPNDINYRTERNGRRYTVIERRYAIFPERSGVVQIPTIRFVGRVQDTRNNGQFNRMFDRGKRITLRSEPVELVVRPRPASFSGTTWLPARSLTLHDPWVDSPPEFRMGEPITRTFILQATGLLETQLPELQTTAMAGFRTYPDQPVSESRKDTPWITAYREEKRAIVPEQPGALTLPEVALAWWDTQADQERIALIPELTVQVLPAADAGSTLPISDNNSAAQAGNGERTVRPPGGLLWPVVSAGLFGLWLLTLLAWLRERRHQLSEPVPASEPQSKTSVRQAQKAFAAACKSNQAPEAARALVTWCDLALPETSCRTLRQVAGLLGSEDASLEVIKLDRALYAPETTEGWQGRNLLQILGKKLPLASGQEQKSGKTSPLPALYS